MTTPQNPMDTLSYDEALAKLESIRKEYKDFVKGKRKTLYHFMQRAAETALSVEADENATSRFRKKMGEKDVLRGALIFIFDAKSEPATKEASKRAQALRYLIDKLGVAVEDIAMAIPKHGGIEKLARLAAKSRPDEADEDLDADHEDDEDQDKPEEAGRQIRVDLSPKLTKKLNQFADKARIKIIGYVRMSADGSPRIEVKKILEALIKKKGGKSKTKATDKQRDDEGDWEE
jgi:hypothetical protein